MAVTVNDLTRKNFQAERDDTLGDNISVTMSGNDEVSIYIQNPWAGDTETGFGQTCNIRLLKGDAIALGHFLVNLLGPIGD